MEYKKQPKTNCSQHKSNIKSMEITEAYMNRKLTLNRFQTSFSGTWKTTLEDFFPLLCPAREADWIPGWTAEVLFSDAAGLVSPNCVFRTDETNTAWGPGLWYFVGYEKNEFVEVLRFNTDMVMRMKIESKDNSDGTVTATWYITSSALTEIGNQAVDQFEVKIAKASSGLPMLIENYLNSLV